jgi:MtN3 and saliva related transmembrane protein
MVEAIGWVSSFILVLTIAKQVYKQWHEGSSEGVSKWLFIGQISASLGFTIYSWLVNNWVFVVTNALMLLNGLLGLVIVFRHRRRERREGNKDKQQGARVDMETERA